MSINKLLCISLLLLSSYSYSASISIETNKSSIIVGDLLEVSVISNKAEIDATEADVYLSIQFPDGTLYYWYDFNILAVTTEIVPLLTNWTVQTLAKTNVFTFEIPNGIEEGTYKWYLTLAKPDSNVEQPTNWLASASAKLALKYAESEGMSEKADSGIYDDISSGIYDEVSSFPSERPSSPSYAGESSDGIDDESFSSSSPPPSYAGESFDDFADEPMIPDTRPTPVAGTLTAGDIDDNLNFAEFQKYLQNQQDSSLPSIDMSDRITFNIIDQAGNNMSNARVRIENKLDLYSGTDGKLYFFPTFDNVLKSQINLQLLAPEDEFGSATSVTSLDLTQLADDRNLTITMPNTTSALPHSLDVMFVVDTTGSMSDELHYLITELRDIISTVQARHMQVHMRFGLIVYRDTNDEYVVQNFDFTSSLNDIQAQLNKQKARGGGDYPEAMDQALETAVNADWRTGNVARLLFLVADAPPHDENLQAMLESTHTARTKGIRIYPLAASGVGDKAEFMMRNAEVLTQGRYLFLTDDSGVGNSHQEPSTSCYIVTRLDQLIARMIDSELAGKRVEPDSTDIFRSVGDYNNGVCSGVEPPPPPVDEDELAKIENIRVQIMESFPVQAQVVAQGYLADGCEKIKQSTSSRDGNLFTVTITTHSVGEVCTDAEELFTETVKLDVNGLKAGTYTVDVNGILDKFKYN